jgi:hypothetical protein
MHPQAPSHTHGACATNHTPPSWSWTRTCTTARPLVIALLHWTTLQLEQAAVLLPEQATQIITFIS